MLPPCRSLDRRAPPAPRSISSFPHPLASFARQACSWRACSPCWPLPCWWPPPWVAPWPRASSCVSPLAGGQAAVGGTCERAPLLPLSAPAATPALSLAAALTRPSCAVYCGCSAVIACVRLLSRLVLGEQRAAAAASTGAASQAELPAMQTKPARKNGSDSVSSSGGIATVMVDRRGAVLPASSAALPTPSAAPRRVIPASSAALPTPSAAPPLLAHAGERQEQQRDGGAPRQRRAAPSLLQRVKKGLRSKPRA